MTHAQRLLALEEQAGVSSGRCPVCRDRHSPVRVVTRLEIPHNSREPIPGKPQPHPPPAAEDLAACPACGWTPERFEVGEVLVYDREQVRAFREWEEEQAAQLANSWNESER
jgi:hypothetical protein